MDMPSLIPDLGPGRPLPDRVPFTERAVARYLEDVLASPAGVGAGGAGR